MNDVSARVPTAEELELERLRIRARIKTTWIGTTLVGVLGIVIPAVLSWAELEQQHQAAQDQLALEYLRQQNAQVTQFAEEFSNQDLEFRLRVTEYLSQVSHENYRADWQAFHESLLEQRVGNRDRLIEIEVELATLRSELLDTELSETRQSQVNISILRLNAEKRAIERMTGFIPLEGLPARRRSQTVTDAESDVPVPGFDPNFLRGSGYSARLEVLMDGQRVFDQSAPLQSGQVLDYPVHSVVYADEGRIPRFAAVHFDPTNVRRTEREPRWRLDSRRRLTQQTHASHFEGPEWDRGHLIAGQFLSWGETDRTAQLNMASAEYYPNALPMQSRFNRSVWLSIERAIATDIEKGRRLILVGPVQESAACSDVELGTSGEDEASRIDIPRGFWLIAFHADTDGQVGHEAYLACQSAHASEQVNTGAVSHTDYAVDMPTVMFASGLVFNTRSTTASFR